MLIPQTKVTNETFLKLFVVKAQPYFKNLGLSLIKSFHSSLMMPAYTNNGLYYKHVTIVNDDSIIVNK